MHKIVLGAFASLLTVLTAPEAANAQSVADFYKGNTVHLVIGSAPGGSFDVYGRIVGKYMAKYIPGNPTVIVQNLPGAGSFVAASRVSVTAPQDGTYIGSIQPTVIVGPILGDPSLGAKELKLAYLGNVAPNVEACFLRTDAPAKSFADGFKTEMVLGASNGGSSSREYASLLKNALGMNIKIVTGYAGNADIFLAVDRNEVQGFCGSSFLSVIATRPEWFAQDIVRAISHQGSKPLPDMKEVKGVKPAVTYAKTEEQRQMLDLYDLQGAFGRPWVTGASVPPDRIAALRAAFMTSMNDPELRADVESRGLEIGPAPGEEIQRMVAEIYATPPELLKKTRVALGYE